MNTLWSDFIQTTDELNESRDLRFNNSNCSLWINAICAHSGIKALEVGCGGGIFCLKLKKYLPDISITGIDIDDGHIERAKQLAKENSIDCDFTAGDIAALPFPNESFDLSYSHTVAEHIPHDVFFKQQYRILKKGGQISVLSVRTKSNITAGIERSDEELELFEKAWKNASETFIDDSFVGKYEMSEHEYPRELEKYGFKNIKVNVFTVIDYAPDSSDVDDATALKQINCHRNGDLSSVRKILNRKKDALDPDELKRLCELINSRYDERIAKYRRNEKLWDFSTSTILAVNAQK